MVISTVSWCHRRPSFRASLAILEFWIILGIKGGSQMVDHKKMQGACKFRTETKKIISDIILFFYKKYDFRYENRVNSVKTEC